jgi:hypothetical protein
MVNAHIDSEKMLIFKNMPGLYFISIWDYVTGKDILTMSMIEFIYDVSQILYSPEVNEVMVSDAYYTTTFFYLDAINV